MTIALKCLSTINPRIAREFGRALANKAVIELQSTQGKVYLLSFNKIEHVLLENLKLITRANDE